MYLLLAVTALFTVYILLSLWARIPIWNPIYYFSGLFLAQMYSGYWLAYFINYSLDVDFWLFYASLHVIMITTFFVCNAAFQREIVKRQDLRSLLDTLRFPPQVQYALTMILNICAISGVLLVGIIVLRWGALPVIAYANNWKSVADQLVEAGVATVSAYREFEVPFFGYIQESVTAVCVVIWFLLSGVKGTDGKRGGGLIVHVPFLIVMACQAVHVRRNSFAFAAALAALLLYLRGTLSVRSLFLMGFGIVCMFGFMGNYRIGERLNLSQRFGLPDMGVWGTIYEWPMMYLGQGVLNFNEYWTRDFPTYNGKLLMAKVLPQFMENIIGGEMDQEMSVKVFYANNLFVIPGQTLRTGWFEVYFDFGVVGTYLFALAFPLFIFWAYLRLIRSDRGNPSVLYLSMFSPIAIFPFINMILSLNGWVPLIMGLLLDYLIRGTSGRAAAAADEPGRGDGDGGVGGTKPARQPTGPPLLRVSPGSVGA